MLLQRKVLALLRISRSSFIITITMVMAATLFGGLARRGKLTENNSHLAIRQKRQ